MLEVVNKKAQELLDMIPDDAKRILNTVASTALPENPHIIESIAERLAKSESPPTSPGVAQVFAEELGMNIHTKMMNLQSQALRSSTDRGASHLR